MAFMARIRTTILAALLWQAVALVSAHPAFAVACDTTKAPVVPVIKGLPYGQARTAILASGWQPVVGHPHNDMASNEATFRDRGYTELQFCRLTDTSPCRFTFSAGNVALWVVTEGDENAMLSTQAIVKSAKLACVGAPDPS
jgi:hypothetical protein